MHTARGSLDAPGPRTARRPGASSSAEGGSARLRASLGLWLVNLALGVALGRLWLDEPAAEVSIHVRLFLPVALVSSVATWALVPGAWMAACHMTLGSRRVSGGLQAFGGAAFLVFLYADTVVYRLLGYHMNSATWNVLSTPGSADAVHLGSQVWAPVALALVLLTAAQAVLWRFLLRRAELRKDRAQRHWGRPVALVGGCVLAVVLVEKSGYAAAHAARDHDLESACRGLPLYPRIHLTPAPDGAAALAQLVTTGSLAYPHAPAEVDDAGPRPNVVMLVVDSWRRDAFSPELTPNLWKFSEGARVFGEHISGGNGTRFGLFSLLYGLHGPYWFPVLEARRPPVLLETLDALGYDMRVFSSASMSFPEFDQTAWANLDPDQVQDDYPAQQPHERDAEMASSFASWLETRAGERPFFAFLLLDAPHQPYSNPGGPFEPAIERFDYLELARGADPDLVERVSNRYRNSVVHADRTASSILAAIEETAGFEQTVVIVTGDHGEEFQECGFWGHTSNFSPAQVCVPFFMKGPGVEPGLETRPTSHVDVSGSLLELLGADPARRADYSLGESLFAPLDRRDRVVAGWSSIGVVSADDIMCLWLDRGEIEFFDHEWNRLGDVERRCNERQPELLRLRRECAAFLQPDG
ncbi:MAG: membrane-anchored protein YejM (alkaline phosphatase superfamily) [Chlamydiales bacterium]